MRYVILILALLTLCPTAQAQYEVDWGPAYKKEGGLFATFYLMGTTESNYYLLMRPRTAGNLYTFDYNHKLVRTTSLPEKIEGKSSYYNRMVETASGSYAFFNAMEKRRRGDYEIYVSKINNDGTFGPMKLYDVGEVQRVKSFSMFGIGKAIVTDPSGQYVSGNKEYFATIDGNYQSDMKGKDEDERIHIEMRNADLEVLWEHDEPFDNEYNDFKTDIVQYLVSDNGDVYATAKLYKDRKDRESGVPNYSYLLFQINEDGYKKIDIELNAEAIPSDVGIFYGEDEQVYLGGFYTIRNSKAHRANGVFYVRINPESGSVEKKVVHEFDQETLDGLIRDKAAKKGKGLRNFDVEVMISHENGDVSFIAEENYVTRHTRTVGDRRETYEVFHTDEILVPRFSDEGDLINITKIDKDYASEVMASTSYTYGINNSKIYLLFNDKKSLKERGESDVKGGRRSRFTDLVVIDENGDIDFWETLFSNKEIETEFYPMLSTQAKDDAILLMGVRKREYQFGTLQLK